jgi:hypothetical protein
MRNFEEHVVTAFRPLLDRDVVSLLDSSVTDSFDNAFVTLASGAFLVRLVRERGRLHGEFCSSTEPRNWFDAAIVAERFEDAPETSFLGVDGMLLLERFARFVEAHSDELSAMFSPAKLAETRVDLERRERDSVTRRFGV